MTGATIKKRAVKIENERGLFFGVKQKSITNSIVSIIPKIKRELYFFTIF
jgi:hypothetical protein